MRQCIFGAWNETGVVPTLFQGLQHLEIEHGDFNEVGIAALAEERIQYQLTNGLQNLQSGLQQQPISGHFGVAYTYPNSSKDIERRYAAHLCANEQVAVAFFGVIDNVREIKCSKLGCPLEYQNDGEMVLRLIDYYFKINGISALEALTLTLARLQGYFVVITLFAEENLLVAARRGCSLCIGVDENVTYLGNNTKALTLLSRRVMQLEEGSLAILRSVKQKV